MSEFTVTTTAREQMIDITAEVRRLVRQSGVKTGAVVCFVPHTSAAVTINENTDPDVTRDILYKLNKDIPRTDNYRHAEGNSDAHVKSSLVGASEYIPIENGDLVLGVWQGIYFCEFDGPRQRRLVVTILPGA